MLQLARAREVKKLEPTSSWALILDWHEGNRDVQKLELAKSAKLPNEVPFLILASNHLYSSAGSDFKAAANELAPAFMRNISSWSLFASTSFPVPQFASSHDYKRALAFRRRGRHYDHCPPIRNVGDTRPEVSTRALGVTTKTDELETRRTEIESGNVEEAIARADALCCAPGTQRGSC